MFTFYSNVVTFLNQHFKTPKLIKTDENKDDAMLAYDNPDVTSLPVYVVGMSREMCILSSCLRGEVVEFWRVLVL